MKRRELVPCHGCARHVDNAEPVCPFCGAARSEAMPAPRRTMPRGSSRAAAFALRAALVTATAGCAASHDPDDNAGAGPGGDGSRRGDAASAHDAAVLRDASVPLGAIASADAAVGASADAARDAAPEAAAEAAVVPSLDASDQDAFVAIPLYGGVFPDPRTRAKV
jgi:hypothetical protein